MMNEEEEASRTENGYGQCHRSFKWLLVLDANSTVCIVCRLPITRLPYGQKPSPRHIQIAHRYALCPVLVGLIGTFGQQLNLTSHLSNGEKRTEMPWD